MNTFRKIICGLAAAAALSSSASAQSLMQGQIVVSGLDMARTEGNLFVTMLVDMQDLDLKTNADVTLTPRLCFGERTAELPALLIAGRNRYFHHLRNGVPEGVTLYRQGEPDRIEYRAALPYEPWMETAQLRAATLACGCCDEPLERDEQQLALLDFTPRVFEPRFIYVSPKGDASKIREVQGSAFIDFPVNRTEIREDYRRNPDELRKIIATIDAVKNDPDTRILAIDIKGYASPEGSYANNTRLAQGRTEALAAYVKRLYALPDELLATDYEPEDWAGLRRYVEASALEHRAQILAIIDGALAPDDKDREIRRRYPEEYALLLRDVYPALRHSDYAVEYEIRTYTDVAQIRRLLRTAPQKLSLGEMYLAAESMEPGSEEYNEVFEIAVRMYPDDEAANINAANNAMARGNLKSAERYLAKAGESPEALYARGIFAALPKSYDTAKELFERAREAGIAHADDAIRQIDELDETRE